MLHKSQPEPAVLKPADPPAGASAAAAPAPVPAVVPPPAAPVAPPQPAVKEGPFGPLGGGEGREGFRRNGSLVRVDWRRGASWV